MIVSRLELADFRNYRSAALDLAPGVTVILGPNGQGKTNLIEAIPYLATGASHRVTGDQALIRNGEDRAILRAELRHGERTVTLEAELNRSGANRLRVNGHPVRQRESRRQLDAVTFAPEDLALVKGDPAGRRRFLDVLLAVRHPRLSAVLADYDRALRQRNTLLKSARAARARETDLGTLDVWDERLATFGAEVVAGRAGLVAELQPHAERAYRDIAGAEDALVLAVEATAPGDVAGFLETLRASRAKELEQGATVIGPHRDDLGIDLNGMPARSHASHGESWSVALALRLASAALLRATAVAGDPVIVLDDVFAELDTGRRSRLVAALRDYEQVIVTAAVAEDVPAELSGATVRISAGEIVDAEG